MICGGKLPVARCPRFDVGGRVEGSPMKHFERSK